MRQLLACGAKSTPTCMSRSQVFHQPLMQTQKGAALQGSTTPVLQTQLYMTNICYPYCVLMIRISNTLHTSVCCCIVLCSAWPFIEVNHASSDPGGMSCLRLCKCLLYYCKATTHHCQQTLALCHGTISHSVPNKEAGLLFNSYQVQIEQG